MQNALARMQMTKAQGDMEREEAFRNSFAGVTDGNYEAALPKMYQADPTRAMAFQKSLDEQKRGRVTMEKDQIEANLKKLDFSKQVLGTLMQNPTDEAVVSAISEIARVTGQAPEEADRKARELLSLPPQGRREYLMFHAAKTEQAIKLLTPELEMQDFGGHKQFVQTNPMAGDVGPRGQKFGKTLSPSDAIAQQGNQTMRDLLLQERQMRVDEGRAKAEERSLKKQSVVAGAQQTLSVIDKALGHPGRSTATGLSGQIDPRNMIAGTDAMDFKTVIDQLQGKAFLEAFESLKGGGQITEMEGKKATDAMARLNRAQSDAEFVKSLNDLRDVVLAGLERMGAQQGGGVAPQPQGASQGGIQKINSDSEYNALPSGAVFIGPDGKQRRKP